jgi:small subunit ribosomal protein S8
MYQVVDFLIRIKNAYLAGRKSLDVFYSPGLEKLARILADNGYLEKIEVSKQPHKKTLTLYLKYEKKSPALSNIKIISRPGLRVYTKSKKIRAVLGGTGISIVSTPRGLMTGRQARKDNLGGELICQVW